MGYFWLIIIILSVIGFILYKKEGLELNKIFKQIAKDFNGRVIPAVITYPSLIFLYYDQTIEVSAMPHEHGAFTYVSFTTHRYSHECIFKITSKSKLPKIPETNKNLKKQKLNLEEFEKKFIVYAKHNEYLVALLTTEICEALMELAQNYSIEVRYIKLNDAFRFDLHIDRVLTSKNETVEAIQLTQLFIQQMDRIKR